MMSSDKQAYYLQAMGVIAWRLRMVEETSRLCYRYQLFDKHDCLFGVLFADSDAQSEETQVKEQGLLGAICQAMGVNSAGELVDSSTESLANDQLGKVVILMGQKVAQHFLQTSATFEGLRIAEQSFNGAAVIVTHSVGDLLKKPMLKAEVWQDLQQAITLMGQ